VPSRLDLSLRRKRQLVVAVLAVAIVAVGSWTLLGGQASSARKSVQAPPAIPVTTALAQKADFAVYLNGLGTVQPFDTVTVRSRVDGEVTEVDFKQGEMVVQGDVLARIDPRPYQAALDQAKAKKAQDEATLKNAQIDLTRYVTLGIAGPQQQLDTQRALVEQLTAQIKGDQGAIDNAQTQVAYTTIRSPLSGRTGFRLVDPGNIVHAADTNGIVTIVKLQPISVVFTAPEQEVSRINKALAAGPMAATALKSDGTTTLAQGKLALVNNFVDQSSGTISMKATFPNKDEALWPGLSVTTRLLVDTLKQVLVVPEDAVQRGPNGLYVFVIGGDNKAQVQSVEVSQEGNGQAVIAKGLTEGQKVVVSGQYRLLPGALVDATEQAAPSPVQAANTAKADQP
jgi:multidrug efflux system membrane fusion protein